MSNNISGEIVASSIRAVDETIKDYGYTIAHAGAVLVGASIVSGYSLPETLSSIFCQIIAQEMRATFNNPDGSMKIMITGKNFIAHLHQLHMTGKISENIWTNDRNAIWGMVYPSSEQEKWLSLVGRDLDQIIKRRIDGSYDRIVEKIETFTDNLISEDE
jgi:hypothetical protein